MPIMNYVFLLYERYNFYSYLIFFILLVPWLLTYMMSHRVALSVVSHIKSYKLKAIGAVSY